MASKRRPVSGANQSPARNSTCPELQTRRIAARHRQRRFRLIGGRQPPARSLGSQRQGDGAAAGPEVGHAHSARRSRCCGQQRQRAFHHQFGLGARNEHGGGHVQRQRPEFALRRSGRRSARPRRGAPPVRGSEPRPRLDRQLAMRDQCGARAIQHLRQQYLGVQRCVGLMRAQRIEPLHAQQCCGVPVRLSAVPMTEPL